MTTEEMTQSRRLPRRSLLRLIGLSGSTALAVNSVRWLRNPTGAESANANGDGILFSPAGLPSVGPFSDRALRAKALSVAAEDKKEMWRRILIDERGCWSEIWPHMYALPSDVRGLRLRQLFEGFSFGLEYAGFCYWLSEVDLRSAPGGGPTEADANALSDWLFGSPTSAIDIRPAHASLEDVQQMRILVDWETGVKLPKNVPELDPDMNCATSGFVISSFSRASEQLIPVARRERRSKAASGGSVIASVVETVVGGHQAISLQRVLSKGHESLLLAQLLARGYVTVGLDGDMRLVFVKLEPTKGVLS